MRCEANVVSLFLFYLFPQFKDGDGLIAAQGALLPNITNLNFDILLQHSNSLFLFFIWRKGAETVKKFGLLTLRPLSSL